MLTIFLATASDIKLSHVSYITKSVLFERQRFGYQYSKSNSSRSSFIVPILNVINIFPFFSNFKNILEQNEGIVTTESEALMFAQNLSMQSLISYQNNTIREMSRNFDKLKALNETILNENERILNTLSAFWRCQEDLKRR